MLGSFFLVRGMVSDFSREGMKECPEALGHSQFTIIACW